MHTFSLFTNTVRRHCGQTANERPGGRSQDVGYITVCTSIDADSARGGLRDADTERAPVRAARLWHRHQVPQELRHARTHARTRAAHAATR